MVEMMEMVLGRLTQDGTEVLEICLRTLQELNGNGSRCRGLYYTCTSTYVSLKLNHPNYHQHALLTRMQIPQSNQLAPVSSRFPRHAAAAAAAHLQAPRVSPGKPSSHVSMRIKASSMSWKNPNTT